MTGRLAGIDAWRGISVALVALSHLARWSNLQTNFTRETSVALGHLGQLGVEVFFGISGFVIARGLLHEARLGRISFRAFYIRRCFRILPPLVLYLAAVVILVVLGSLPPEALQALRSLTFTCNIVACGDYSGWHLWSLSVEEQFYIALPLLFFLSAGYWRITVPLACLAMPFCTIALYGTGHNELATALRMFLTIAAGVLCAFAETQLVPAVRRASGWTFGVAVIAVVALWMTPSTAATTVVQCFALPAAIMWVLLGAAMRDGVVNSLLARSPLPRLGLISYGVYLWQELATYPWPGAGPLFYLLSTVGCVAVAAASYRWIEQPLIDRGRQLARAQGQRVPAATDRPPAGHHLTASAACHCSTDVRTAQPSALGVVRL
ncbi:MAG: acyltransferase [Pseudomonadota bacterium]